MAELTLKTGDKDKDGKTVAAEIGMAGIHIFTDKGFFDRIDSVDLYYSNYLTEKEIEAKTLSPIRQEVLRRAMRAARYVFGQMPYGKGAERPRILRALQTCNDLLLNVEECIDSDIADEDCASICRDITKETLKVPPALFDTENTTVNKAFTVHGIPNTQGKIVVTSDESNPTS